MVIEISGGYLFLDCFGSVIHLRRRHVAARQIRWNFCSCSGNATRIYQMDAVHDRSCTRWSRWFHWYIFDRCECGNVRCVDHGIKEFDLIKLLGRHLYDPKQFTIDEELLESAGLLPEAIPSRDGRIEAFRLKMRLAEQALRCRSNKLQSRSDRLRDLK